MKTQRDAFIDRLYDIAHEFKDIVLCSADMGAPALDKFREHLPGQYIATGISEQNTIAVAAGLALGGKKVFTYAIAPFITLRCYEHIRIELAAMNLPVTIVGVGAGMSYDDSGPTHHAVEDISVMRILPNMRVHNITDSVMAEAFAYLSCWLDYPNYVRLDREALPNIYTKKDDFSRGLITHELGDEGHILATGNMVHVALSVASSLLSEGFHLGVTDIFTFPINKRLLLKVVAGAKILFTLEEHTLPGGLGSAVCEVLADEGLNIPVKRFGLDLSSEYCYKYGGREHLQSIYGLDKESLIRRIKMAL